jgi:hypothetical protein
VGGSWGYSTAAAEAAAKQSIQAQQLAQHTALMQPVLARVQHPSRVLAVQHLCIWQRASNKLDVFSSLAGWRSSVP